MCSFIVLMPSVRIYNNNNNNNNNNKLNLYSAFHGLKVALQGRVDYKNITKQNEQTKQVEQNKIQMKKGGGQVDYG